MRPHPPSSPTSLLSINQMHGMEETTAALVHFLCKAQHQQIGRLSGCYEHASLGKDTFRIGRASDAFSSCIVRLGTAPLHSKSAATERKPQRRLIREHTPLVDPPYTEINNHARVQRRQSATQRKSKACWPLPRKRFKPKRRRKGTPPAFAA
jgi:hypothetical protein